MGEITDCQKSQMTCLFDKQVIWVSWHTDTYDMLQKATGVWCLTTIFMKIPPQTFWEQINSLLTLILCHRILKIQVSEGFRHLMSMGAQHHRESEPRYMVQNCQVDWSLSKWDWGWITPSYYSSSDAKVWLGKSISHQDANQPLWLGSPVMLQTASNAQQPARTTLCCKPFQWSKRGKKGLLDMPIHLKEREELLSLPSGLALRIFSIGIVVMCSNLASFIFVDCICILGGINGKYNMDFWSVRLSFPA